MKKVVTMQDISCVGKCSLTVALPILSAMGIETAVIPTAVLSTHTMFQGFTFHDLTNEIIPIMEHWKKEKFRFDAVYTGYLGSVEQIGIAVKLFDEFGAEGLKIVDPCMADMGKLYAGFTEEFVRKMAVLCAKADIICPNLTEASFLLNIPYVTEYDEEYIRTVLKKLTGLGVRKAVITGIVLDGVHLGAYSYDSDADRYFSYFTDKESESFHGTGDIWASTLCGALIQKKTFDEAVAIACDYVKESIHVTLQEPEHNRYGVNFEQTIPYLIRRMNLQ